MTSRRPFQRTFQPGFIPGSLYLAITSISGSSQGYFLGFFYLERPTLTPNVAGQLKGQYWLLAPTLGLRHGEESVQNALYNPSVLGYARVAENVGLDRLGGQITQDHHNVKELGWSSAQWAFNVMDRLRRQGIVRSLAVLWSYEQFHRQVEQLHKKWIDERSKFSVINSLRVQKTFEDDLATAPQAGARPFTEFFLCDFVTKEH